MRDKSALDAGGLITSLAGIIEAYAALDKHSPEATMMTILDAVTAEIVWNLSDEFDVDYLITKHADNVAEMVSEMVKENG